ncbi:MAG: SoxR reducing system RseC family protein [Nitrospirae bacterium]|nr:SoxR reducing system RseC family protein [Nitrospirota bacterium]MBF0533620.1 SoxR reducing system RseC family protein [Nitrospirota bacterium]MBF0616729.1 SoxR reducing system RseC family protein [Nitrospirota bacterium]
MDETGVVKAVRGHIAIVEVQKTNACHECPQSGECSTNDNVVELEALNEAQAKAGQRVLIVMRRFTYMKGTFLVYGFPALALILGAVFGKYFLSQFFNGVSSELISAITGLGAFAVLFFIASLISRKMEKTTENKPVVTKIL